jgi:hypothetical protein
VLRSVLLAALLLSTAGSVFAVEAPFKGVFVTDPEFCDQVGEEGTFTIFGNDISILSLNEGLFAWEFSCDFNQIVPDGDGLEISAKCMNPGEQFDDQIYLSVYDQTRIEFNSPLITGTRRPGDGGEEYRYLFSRCDQVKELKLD